MCEKRNARVWETTNCAVEASVREVEGPIRFERCYLARRKMLGGSDGSSSFGLVT